jgi:circadian clock protein KaiB
MDILKKDKAEGKSFIFRLFVTDDETHSRKAKNNLRKFCASHINDSFEIEVVDVLKDYTIALENKIFLTPALVVISPDPPVTIFGDLSDTQELINLLRLEGNA